LLTIQFVSVPKRFGFVSERNCVSVIQKIEKGSIVGGASPVVDALDEEEDVGLAVTVCV
jgi:hypothetical protein